MNNQPNILHLFTDMQRWDTIHALGNGVIKTPNLDRLFADGVAFTNAFSPSPVCISARCSMIHGQYPMHTGCYENSCMPSDGRDTFMDGLTRVGYRTHGIGKCHFTPDRHALRGFQTRLIQEEGGLRSMEELEREDYLRYLHQKGYHHICEPHGIRGEMYYIPQPSQLPAADHPTQWIADRSIEFLRDPNDSGRPWYLFSSFIHPHPPLTPPNPWHKLYREPMMPLPLVPEEHEALLTYANRMQNRYKYRDQGSDPHLVRLIVAYYYACISFVDYQAGRILDALENSGQRENTLIVFTSDHGEFLGRNRCYGKRSMHDPSARIPMLLSMPDRFEGGIICDRPVSLVDLAPTFLNLAGAHIDSHDLDGEDLCAVAAGSSARQYVFSQISTYQDGANRRVQGRAYDRRIRHQCSHRETPEQVAAFSSYMCVSREWKYFYSAPDDREFLFDKIGDPHETRNRAALPFTGDAFRTHKSALIKHLRDGGETAGLDGNEWRVFERQSISDDPDTGLLVQDSYTPWSQMALPAGYR